MPQNATVENKLAQHDDIKVVKDDGQGHAFGVKPGWRITKILSTAKSTIRHNGAESYD